MTCMPAVRLAVTMIAAILLVLSAAGCGGEKTAPVEKAAAEPSEKFAPDFTLESLDGGTLTLSETNGKVRILDFWATWCKPCIEEMPMYKELHAEWSDRGVMIIGISIDEDGAEVVRPFIEKEEIPYTNLLATEEIEELYRPFGHFGVPSTFVLDREGRIVEHFPGQKPKKVLVGLIEELLAQEG